MTVNNQGSNNSFHLDSSLIFFMWCIDHWYVRPWRPMNENQPLPFFVSFLFFFFFFLLFFLDVTIFNEITPIQASSNKQPQSSSFVSPSILFALYGEIGLWKETKQVRVMEHNYERKGEKRMICETKLQRTKTERAKVKKKSCPFGNHLVFRFCFWKLNLVL